MSPNPAPPKLAPQLIKPQEAADLLNVDIATVRRWIAKDAIPYVKLPGNGKPSYRIPLQGLINSMTANFDLAGIVEELYRDEAAEAAAASDPAAG